MCIDIRIDAECLCAQACTQCCAHTKQRLLHHISYSTILVIIITPHELFHHIGYYHYYTTAVIPPYWLLSSLHHISYSTILVTVIITPHQLFQHFGNYNIWVIDLEHTFENEIDVLATGSEPPPYRHRRRHAYRAGKGVPVHGMTASARAFQRCGAHAQQMPARMSMSDGHWAHGSKMKQTFAVCCH